MQAFLINIANFFIKQLGLILSAVCLILPNSPFKGAINNSIIAEYLPTLNYFLPLTEIIVILETWVLAIGSFYLVQVVLRWLKAIE